MSRPAYLHNETEAYIPLVGLLSGDIDAELVYDAVTDVIWHRPTQHAVVRRYLLDVFRKVRRKRHGYAKGASISMAPGVWISVRRARPILAICADMRRHVPQRRRLRDQTR